MAQRKIVQIDESKCNGCGLCVPSCAEGAIQIINGKARLVSEVYCDGLGACLGHCPEDAITIIEREAADFDEAAVADHLKKPATAVLPHARPLPMAGHGCPGSAARQLPVRQPTPAVEAAEQPSRLTNWPVQLHLVPPQAAYLRNADLLFAADCVPFAYADFHRRFLNGQPLLIGCPKLDDGQFYVEKLAEIIKVAKIKSINVVHMEVPCCTGLLRIAEAAIAASGPSVPLRHVVVSLDGKILGQ